MADERDGCPECGGMDHHGCTTDHDVAISVIRRYIVGWHDRWLGPDGERVWEMGGQHLRREPMTDAQKALLAEAEGG